MIPYLKQAKEASVSAVPETMKREPDEEPEYDSLESAAEELSTAIHSKDIKGIAMALRAAFEIMDSEPHEEGEHI